MPEENTPQDPQETPQENPETPVEATEETPTAENSLEESPANAEAQAENAETPQLEAETTSESVEETPAAEEPQAEAATPTTEPEVTAEETETVAAEPEVAQPAAEESQPETPVPSVEAEEKTEATAGEGEKNASEEESIGFEEADAGVEIHSTLLAEIMGSEEEFKTVLENSGPQELALLMENIAIQSDVSGLISRGGDIQKAFKALRDGEGEIDDAAYSRFQTAFAKFNKKRKEYFEKREVEKEENSKKKYELLDKLKEIVEAEKVAAINEVREIQTQWKEIGWVKNEDVVPLSRTYKHYLDIFYTLRGHYNELRDRDRQYNLEDKLRLIAEIEDMIPEESNIGRDRWNELTNKLNNLRDLWKTTGHVPRENADEVISRYRNALDLFFETRSSFYQAQDQKREENAEKKLALLEKLKPYAEYQSNKAKEWNKATDEVLAIQKEWKEIGPAPKEQNKELWKTYREICDTFFNKKGHYFKSFDEERQANLDAKEAICAKAEELAESQDWEATAAALKQLQQDWNDVGPVHQRHSNKVWKRFRAACDKFFEKRAKAKGLGADSQKENLEKKEAILKQLEELLKAEVIGDIEAEAFKNLQVEWKSIGHVPFKQKDKINAGFRELANQFYRKLDETNSESRRIRFETRLEAAGGRGGRKGGGGKRGGGGGSPISKLNYEIREIESKIDSYETNILYIAKGKKGDALRAQIQKQIDQEKDNLKKLRAKIKELKDGPKEEKPKKEKAAKPAAEAPVSEETPEKSEASANETSAEATEAPAAEATVEAAPEAPAEVAETATEEPVAEAESENEENTES